eukprot:TRINITY_DN11454_c0_g1_i1.p1 TRINITY_DN11454_c0_g1~~TRINITY_DN11454_c0_g1_i1.p1  ORF type:complete len:586 (+),score=205.68 TRINITY_DN11454_c0_g1_i1:114-1871(+)
MAKYAKSKYSTSGVGRVTEITPFYRAFISFISKRDMVREIEKRKKLNDKQQLFDPMSAWSVWLRKLSFIAVIYNILTVPFRIAYLVPRHPLWIALDALADIPPILRIISTFLSPYEETGRRDIVRNRAKIIEKYLTGTFPLDIVSHLPLDYIFLDVWWRVFRLLQWKRSEYLQKDWEANTKTNPMTYRMGKVILLILIPIIHLVACAWYIITRKYSKGTGAVTPMPVDFMVLAHFQPTLDEIKTVDIDGYLFNSTSTASNPYKRAFHNYITSLYFSVVYLVGYNAGIPRNLNQAIFCLVVVFLGASVFALVIGYVGLILKELDNTQQLFRDKVDNMVAFMKYGELPPKTVKNVQHFYKHMWESRRGLEGMHTMDTLPVSLGKELLTYLHKDFVCKVPLFKGCDDLFLEEVSCCLQYVAVLPGYYVLKKGEVGKEMFFIQRGQVDVVSEDNRIVFASLTEGNFFGEVALVVPGAKRTASIVCKTFTELFVLNKNDFESLLDSYPETRAKILQVAVERGLITKPTLPEDVESKATEPNTSVVEQSINVQSVIENSLNEQVEDIRDASSDDCMLNNPREGDEVTKGEG